MISIAELEKGDYVFVIISYRNEDWALVGGKEEDVVRCCEIERIFDDGRVRINFHDDYGFPHIEIVRNTMLYYTNREAVIKLTEMIKLETEMRKKTNLRSAIVALLIIITAVYFILKHY